MIDALANFGDLSTSESIVQQIPGAFLVHPKVQVALIHMWVSKIHMIMLIVKSFELIT